MSIHRNHRFCENGGGECPCEPFTMDINPFLNYLSSIHPLSEGFRKFAAKDIKEEFYTKNQVILGAGQIANRLWFIRKGFAMEYSYRKKDKLPYRFWNEGEIMVDVSSFFKQAPSEGYIEIQETSNLLAINYEQMQFLLQQFPETHIIVRTIIEEYHNYAEKKALDLLTLSSEERYLQLLRAPYILQKASTENIAAFLGVSRKTLSRIRAKRNHK